jgi:hypothetical protein
MQVIYPTTAINTPAIITSAGTALADSAGRRLSWSIQNLGTNPLFVLLGSGASSTVFHYVLKGATGNDDGTGGSIAEENGCVYTGIITVAGTSPRFVVRESAP